MELSTFEAKLSDLTRDVWLISESEYPFTYIQPGIARQSDIVNVLAQEHQVDVQQVKAVAPNTFLSKIERVTSPADAIVVSNTGRIKKLLEFLQQHLKQLNVYRVETGVSVPVYIIGFLPGHVCVGVSSTSIET